MARERMTLMAMLTRAWSLDSLAISTKKALASLSVASKM
jgi:hypothetical protein